MSSNNTSRRASHAKAIQRDEILVFLEQCEKTGAKPYAFNYDDDTEPETYSGIEAKHEEADVIIEFKNVSKEYKLYKNERGRFLNIFNPKSEHSLVSVTKACSNLSFTIHRGEAVALLGRNGAGKSTTLKMITGVVYPTSGEIVVNGRVSALLELTTGFDSKLTGRENIALRGQILGLTNEHIAELEPGIVDFAELGDYIDQPLRTYSSGMKSRLGFAFAVSVDPEILVIDEALSVGDKTFQKKCIERIREIMKDENVTVLFVTHASATAKDFCKRGLVLDHGKLLFDGDIVDATRYYSEHCLDVEQDTVDLPEPNLMAQYRDFVVQKTNLLMDTDAKGLAKVKAPSKRDRSSSNADFSASWYNFAEQDAEPPEKGIQNAFQWTVQSTAGTSYKVFYFYTTACLELRAGNEYTIGCWVYCSTERGLSAALQIKAPQESYPTSKDLGIKYFGLSAGWQYIATSFTCDQTRTNYRAVFGCQARGYDAIYRICGFALVEGSPSNLI